MHFRREPSTLGMVNDRFGRVSTTVAEGARTNCESVLPSNAQHLILHFSHIGYQRGRARLG